MATMLPIEIDCRRLLAHGGVLVGSIKPASLKRVGGNYRAQRETSARLVLARDEGGRMFVSGSFSAPLEAQCQRCLEWMPVEVTGEFELDIVPGTNAAAEGDNVVAAENGRLKVVELIEDEVLLACPMIPLHAAPDCRGDELPAAGSTDESRPNPFAGLGELMKLPRDID